MSAGGKSATKLTDHGQPVGTHVHASGSSPGRVSRMRHPPEHFGLEHFGHFEGP